MTTPISNNSPPPSLNKIWQAATSAAKSPNMLKNIKSLTQDERHFLLSILKENRPSEINQMLANPMYTAVYKKLTSTETPARNNSLIANINRIFKNLFFSRLSSRALIKAVQKTKNPLQTLAPMHKNIAQNTSTVSNYANYARANELTPFNLNVPHEVITFIFDKLPDGGFQCIEDENENLQIQAASEGLLLKALKEAFPDFDGYTVVKIPGSNLYRLEIQKDAMDAFYKLHCENKDMFDDIKTLYS